MILLIGVYSCLFIYYIKNLIQHSVAIYIQACQYLPSDKSYYSLGTQQNAKFEHDGSNLKIKYTGGTDDRYGTACMYVSRNLIRQVHLSQCINVIE